MIFPAGFYQFGDVVLLWLLCSGFGTRRLRHDAERQLGSEQGQEPLHQLADADQTCLAAESNSALRSRGRHLFQHATCPDESKAQLLQRRLSFGLRRRQHIPDTETGSGPSEE